MKIIASLTLATAVAASPIAGLPAWRALGASEKHTYTYEAFLAEHGGTGSAHSRETFETNLANIHAHNAKGLSWTDGVNQFTDMTPEEFAAFKGKYFRGIDTTTAKMTFDTDLKDLPKEIDWRTKGAVTPTKNQGGCGSCWAFSATESVESAVFRATGHLPILAPQEFVDCIPNPNSCGGTGGCSGSTEEYGFAWAMIYGMALDSAYNYTAATGKECLLGKDGRDAVAGISNFVKLPGNDYASLMTAVGTIGPVSISVDASWGAYEKGVYAGCSNKTTTIDHAVQAVGYGTEGGADYWLVRNSWGATWGEGGYIKLPRADPTVDPSICGEDMNPDSGNGCKGGPKEQKVCGACGMLSDSSYPTGGYMRAPDAK